MKKPIFKYYPEDFGKLSIKVIHMDLFFDIFADNTNAKSILKAITLDEEISELILDANNLDIKNVKCDIRKVEYESKKVEDKLIIKFDQPIPKKTQFLITTENIITPTKNILEGLYYDETPKGAPPTQITQCQQWGFQRLVPCIDDMTAKCTYLTTITADCAYTNILSNGDIKKERHSIGDGRDKIVYENIKTPMAPYLFFLGVGTYETEVMEFEYPDGSKFDLELLILPNSDKQLARRALEILYDGIMWIYLFTGKCRYKNHKISNEILELIRNRDILKENKENSDNLNKIREELKEKIKEITFGYKYTGTVYREIAMQNSNFGGMENVGNTTITANRIMPFKESTDGSFDYMIKVKVHEFYHNINGSEVTGYSPFELWLNEAVTVHIEKEYNEFLFGKCYSRLSIVLNLLAPGSGTFSADESPASMPIIPEGFNNPDELISSITYIKAPELINMIEILMGKAKFSVALANYHKKYAHSSATTKQWLAEMNNNSSIDLTKFSKTWLRKTGFPKVKVTESYDEVKKEYKLHLNQENATAEEYWEFPFSAAVFDENGKLIQESMTHVKDKETDIIFKDVDKPGFVSLNRGYSFYGKVISESTNEQLLAQVKSDNDVINRYMAFYHLIDREKLRLLKDKEACVSDEIVDLYFSLLNDENLMNLVGAQVLTIFESVEDSDYSHRYQDLYDVKRKIRTQIANKYKDELLNLYTKYSVYKSVESYVPNKVRQIKTRGIKNLILGLISLLDTEDVHLIIKKQFESSDNATDKVSAFMLYLNTSAKDKLKVLEDYEPVARKSLVSWETFLYAIALNDSDDSLDIIKRIEKSKDFRIEQANDQNALFGCYAQNKKKSLQSESGRKFIQDAMIKLANINEYTALRLIKIFGFVDSMEEKYHVPLIKILVRLLENVDENKSPSVFNTTKRILHGLPKAVKKYEDEVGKIKFLE